MNHVTLDQAMEIAVAHHRAGRLPEAEDIYRKVLAVESKHPDALHLLGVIANQVKEYQAAMDLIQQAIAVSPGSASFHCDLGNVFLNLGSLDQAQAAYERAISLQSDLAIAWNNLASIHGAKGNLDEEINCLRRAIAAAPGQASYHSNLGYALSAKGALDEAIREGRRATELDPNLAPAWGNLGNFLNDVGEFDQAVACYERSLQLEKSPLVHSSKLCAMHYKDGISAQILLDEHRLWDQTYCTGWKTLRRAHSNTPDPARPLRIGYLSQDLREHPVGRFMLPLLQHHDKEQFRVYCYSPSACEDGLARRLQQHTEVWRSLVGVSKQNAIELIRSDGIDILVDLSLMSGPDHMLVFAAKPAPVQASYLGYCSTTGLDAMTYRLTDRFLDPPEFPAYYSEESVYLETTYWCYAPVEQTPDVNALPMLSNGYLTFGCMNSCVKVTPSTLSTWATLLQAIPMAHLLLHAHAGIHQDRLRAFFSEAGIASERIEYVPRQSVAEYFRTYHRIDLALDPFPFGGGTTSCDALWMGVPLVTLRGQTAVGRGGVSLLSNLGLEHLVANDTQQYIRIARQLAEPPGQLAELRAGLRRRMLSSPIMNAAAFARDVERCYRWMWQQWCASQMRQESP